MFCLISILWLSEIVCIILMHLALHLSLIFVEATLCRFLNFSHSKTRGIFHTLRYVISTSLYGEKSMKVDCFSFIPEMRWHFKPVSCRKE
ncbi:hypothetical protein DAI22_05g035500 [Oryza sativa Japonica Group]|nr:hypothetical protein DAI22_05g035500 [Oryza sativa Japonica Group]